MQRLIVDMDDVLADATGRLIDLYEKEFGVRVTRESMNHKEDRERFPDNEAALRFVFQKGFFRTMNVNEYAQEVMKELNKKYEVFVVSSAMEFPNSLSEKLEWLNEHFPFLHWKQFVFCGRKSVVHGDYMIDDLPHNLETFNGEKLLYTAPHNMQFNHFKRVNGWKEVSEVLLG